MKYNIIFLFFIFSFINLFANEKKNNNFLFEVKTAYFHFQDDTARAIYSDGGFMPSIEGSYRLYKVLHLFSEAAFFYKNGKVELTETKNRLIFVPVSLGLKPIFDISKSKKMKFYFKVAPNWYWVQEKQKYPFLKRKKSKTGFGGTFGIGALQYITPNFVLDVFFNYLYDKKTIKDPTSELKFKRYFGGIQAGAGLGYSF